MHQEKRFILKHIIRLIIISFTALMNNSKAQSCAGVWTLQRPLTVECNSGQWIGWQNSGPPLGCPINPSYTGVQTNTFTFSNPVSSFFINFNGFDGSSQCPRIQVRINGIFYPLSPSNILDFPPGTTCMGSFSALSVTPDGYIVANSATGGGQGVIFISNVVASSVTISTNDGAGTLFSNPYNCNNIIPLKLESFTGNRRNDCKTMLHFKTGIEINIKNIEVQQSKDGFVFINSGSVIPKGSNSEYSLLINDPLACYFRLKLNDLDTNFELSEIIHIRSVCKENDYTVVPNPAKDYVEIVGLENNDQVILTDISANAGDIDHPTPI